MQNNKYTKEFKFIRNYSPNDRIYTARSRVMGTCSLLLFFMQYYIRQIVVMLFMTIKSRSTVFAALLLVHSGKLRLPTCKVVTLRLVYVILRGK